MQSIQKEVIGLTLLQNEWVANLFTSHLAWIQLSLDLIQVMQIDTLVGQHQPLTKPCAYTFECSIDGCGV